MAGFNPNYKLTTISSNWLAGVDDKTPISSIAYMSGHNSAAWMNARSEDWWQVQNQRDKDLTAQFAAGARGFSLRFATPRNKDDGSQLTAVHKWWNLNSTLSDLERQLVRSLASNPSEFAKVTLDIYENGEQIQHFQQGQGFFSKFLEPINGKTWIDPWGSDVKSKLWSQEVFDRYGLNDLPEANKQQLLGKPMVWLPKAEKKYLKDPKTGQDATNSKGQKIELDAWAVPTVGDVRGKFIFQIPWLYNGLPSDPSKPEFQAINALYPGTLNERKPAVDYFHGKLITERSVGDWLSPNSLALLDPALKQRYPKGLFSNIRPQSFAANSIEQPVPFSYDYDRYDKLGFKDDAGRVRDMVPEIISGISQWGPEFLGFYGVYAAGSLGAVYTRWREANVVYNENGLKQALFNADSGTIKGEFHGDYIAWDRDNFDIPAAYVADKTPSIDLFLQKKEQSARAQAITGQEYILQGYVDDPAIKKPSSINVRIRSLDKNNVSPFKNLKYDNVTGSYILATIGKPNWESRKTFEIENDPNGPGAVNKMGRLIFNEQYSSDSFLLDNYINAADGSLVKYGGSKAYSIRDLGAVTNPLAPMINDLI